jgi:hypothetical protein
MRGAAGLLFGAIGGLLGAAAGAAAEGVALVEEIGTPHPGIEAMDTLSAGQMIPLRPGERLVLDYLKSCTRETITGGVVSVGAAESIVIGGEVKREKVECGGGETHLSAEQASKSAVMVFREVKLGTASKTAPR